MRRSALPLRLRRLLFQFLGISYPQTRGLLTGWLMGAAGKRNGENENQHEQTLVVTIEPEGVDEIAQESGVYHYKGNSEPQGHRKEIMD